MVVFVFGLIFLLVFSLFWGFIEITIRWFFLEKLFVWSDIGFSLLSSILTQLLQVIGMILTFILIIPIFEKLEQGAVFDDDFQAFLIIVAFLFLKFITDSAISWFFLRILKKDFKSSLKASLIPSFISVFLLYGLIMSLASS